MNSNKIKCTHCNEIKSRCNFHNSVLKNKWYCCKDCRKKAAKKYYIKNKDKLVLDAKKWKMENSERSTEYHKNYDIQHKERIKIYRLKYSKRPEIIKRRSDRYKSLSKKERETAKIACRDRAAKNAKTLSDTYIACTMLRSNKKTIPNELIELKRSSLKLKRAVYNQTNAGA